MIYSFESNSADGVWRDAAAAIVDRGTAQPSRNGPTHELLHVALQITDPRQRWVASRREAMNVAFALAEVVWIVGGRNDAAFLNFFNSQLPRYAGEGPTYHGAYGWRLRRQFDFDQLRRAAAALAANPDSRQIVLTIWDGRTDLPLDDGLPRSKDIPCNIVSMLKVRGASLDWTQVMRSNDAYRGLPHNIVQFTMLQEIVAGWAGLQPGLYTHWSDSLHLYDTDTDQNPVVTPAMHLPFNRESVALPLAEFDRIWPEVESLTAVMVDEKITAGEIVTRVQGAALPASWLNVVRVMAAEAIRRRKGSPEELAMGITNATLRTLWNRWSERMTAKAAGG